MTKVQCEIFWLIDNYQKLHYLKSSLNAIDSLELMSANYTVAYKYIQTKKFETINSILDVPISELLDGSLKNIKISKYAN